MTRLSTTDAPSPEEKYKEEREKEYKKNYWISFILAVTLGGALCGTWTVIVDLFFR